MKTTNALEYLTNGEDIQIYPEGVMVSKIKLVPNIPTEKRHKFLYSIGLEFSLLNPLIKESDLLNWLNGINYTSRIILVPLPISAIITIVKQINKKILKEGEDLLPKENHLRKIIISDNYTKEEKIKLYNQKIGEMKKDKTINEINDVINNWTSDEKITQKEIAIKLNKSIITIKRYWPEFKTIVKIKNQNIMKIEDNKLDETANAILDDIYSTVSTPIKQKITPQIDSNEELELCKVYSTDKYELIHNIQTKITCEGSKAALLNNLDMVEDKNELNTLLKDYKCKNILK